MNKTPSENPYEILLGGPQRRRQRRRQLWGVGLGVVIAWLVGWAFPLLTARLTWPSLLLWGAAIGGAAFDWRAFEQAGHALTHSDNRRLNLALGLGIPFGLMALITFVF